MKLPNSLRDQLKTPLGILLPIGQDNKENIQKYLLDESYIITVGDRTTEKMIEYGIIPSLQIIDGFEKRKVKEVQSGEICAITGIEGFDIGDTIADLENPEALPTIKIDEPTMSMTFTINDSPFFGKDGKFVTSRQIKERLEKEEEKNLALRVEKTESADTFRVFGRGVLHLSVLIETMRREGYELQIGQPQVIIKEIDGVKCEPIEELTIDIPEKMSGKAIEMITIRKGEITIMEPKGDLMHLEFTVPSRGIIGLRNYLITATSGEAIMSHRFKEFQPFKGFMPARLNGSLISMEQEMLFLIL